MIEKKRHCSRARARLPQWIDGVPFEDPHPISAESAEACQQRVQRLLMHAIRECHHKTYQLAFNVKRCSVEPPRGPHHKVAFIICTYGLNGMAGGWNCTFSVSYSLRNGYRLWAETRQRVRMLRGV